MNYDVDSRLAFISIFILNLHLILNDINASHNELLNEFEEKTYHDSSG